MCKLSANQSNGEREGRENYVKLLDLHVTGRCNRSNYSYYRFDSQIFRRYVIVLSLFIIFPYLYVGSFK